MPARDSQPCAGPVAEIVRILLEEELPLVLQQLLRSLNSRNLWPEQLLPPYAL